MFSRFRNLLKLFRPRMARGTVAESNLQRVASNPKMNAIESAMAALPQIETPLVHRFTPGLYIRQITMPAGALITSKIHKTEHPFVILKGEVSVWTEHDGVVRLKAPHVGITKAATRRLLYIHEDTVWATFHPSEKETVEEIEKDIIYPHAITAAKPEEISELLNTKELALQ